MLHRILISAIFCFSLLPFQVFAITSFSYTSSPQSWVGSGDTVVVTPNEGFNFVASRNLDNSVSFAINDFNSNPNFQNFRWWYLDFAGPSKLELAVGDYFGATRFGFQLLSDPGLTFWGNGRANNALTGQFSILEVVYDLNGQVLAFAADFTQYDEGNKTWWNVGAIRYNSSIGTASIPEPSTLALFVVGLAFVGIGTVAKRRLS